MNVESKTTKEQVEEWMEKMPSCVTLEETPVVEKLQKSAFIVGDRLPEIYDNGYRIRLVLQSNTWSEKDE